jgi:hypothetical protein
MGLGHISPEAREWRESALEWLESANDQTIINIYLEEVADPTTPWHLQQITKEMEDRELWPYINTGEDNEPV